MKLEFNFGQVSTAEFGVGRDDGDEQTFCLVAVDGDVQTALGEIARATWETLQELSKSPSKYEPSETYASSAYVYLPLSDDLAKPIRELHQANNLPMDVNALKDPTKIFCYFVRMTDKQGRRLTGLRRATQFKGLLKSRLIRLVSDALKFVEDRIFKLDSDFDLLVDDKNVHIFRPSGFEFACKLQDAVLAAVPENVRAIRSDLEFVDFDAIEDYASKHSRAARYLASIRSQNETKNVNKGSLKKLCKKTGVQVKEVNGKLIVEKAHVMGFLEVLDRRRYEVELVKGSPEQFKAHSRRRIEARS
ncbi:MAG TPA: Kiwa anti-phage protein KwaB-like domain-containing protein [Methylomirabilota bacterium]|nr:Kiwa anti-phage protein KwaB-like domain-containing protein [Methylomirabilota bacterium]